MVLHTFYDNWPLVFLWAVSRAGREKKTANGVPNRPNYCVIFIVYTQFTKVAAGRGLQTP
jgi:hypothetical protein